MKCASAARVVPLHEIGSRLVAPDFNLVVNRHSFVGVHPEAVAWWAQHFKRLRIPNLLLFRKSQLNYSAP
jgi:hypothetical protein